MTINAAVGANDVVDWESELDEATPASLVELNLRTRGSRLLARPVLPNYGIAATAGWVVFATPGRHTALVAVRHGGGDRVELTDRLVAPVAGRGDRVAWAERAGTRLRVVVRNMASGREWVAADLPRCSGGKCYRIDYVTLAARGVVFDRGAIGPQPSFVVRRAFAARRATYWRVAHDPQPDLAPSSAGALFYVSGRGWYRWDFGVREPVRTRFTSESLGLRLARRFWVTSTSKSCTGSYEVVDAGGHRVAGLSWPAVVEASRLNPAGCGTLEHVDATGRRVTSTWLYERHPGDDEAPVGLSVVSLVVSQSY